MKRPQQPSPVRVCESKSSDRRCWRDGEGDLIRKGGACARRVPRGPLGVERCWSDMIEEGCFRSLFAVPRRQFFLTTLVVQHNRSIWGQMAYSRGRIHCVKHCDEILVWSCHDPEQNFRSLSPSVPPVPQGRAVGDTGMEQLALG